MSVRNREITYPYVKGTTFFDLKKNLVIHKLTHIVSACFLISICTRTKILGNFTYCLGLSSHHMNLSILKLI